MTWAEITRANRHGLGLETISNASIKAPIPDHFQDTRKFIALRYSDRLPMVGARDGDVYHVVWIERTFGEVYDH